MSIHSLAMEWGGGSGLDIANNKLQKKQT
jgi:hypothetical protein